MDSEAIKAKARAELAPMIGDELWQITPETAERYVERAVSNPEFYAETLEGLIDKAGRLGNMVDPELAAELARRTALLKRNQEGGPSQFDTAVRHGIPAGLVAEPVETPEAVDAPAVEERTAASDDGDDGGLLAEIRRRAEHREMVSALNNAKP